jgi:hypothetical protein
MRPVAWFLLAISLSACMVRATPRQTRQRVIVEEREQRCPPAHHYEHGAGCVHNGKAKGHSK